MQIHKHATREQKLKEKLIQMQTWLSELHYRIIKYGPAHKTTSGDIYVYRLPIL
jgi:hypothetical protein